MGMKGYDLVHKRLRCILCVSRDSQLAVLLNVIIRRWKEDEEFYGNIARLIGASCITLEDDFNMEMDSHSF